MIKHTPTTSSRIGRWLLTGLAVFATVACLSSVALAQKATWSAKDVRGKSVTTAQYRGKATLVFITSDETRDKMKPITKKMVLKYGHNKKVDQVTIVDLRDAPLTWKGAEKVSGEVTKKSAQALDRTVKRIQKTLKADGQRPIPGLKRKLHMVLDWDGDIVKQYKTWDTGKFITVVLVNAQGDTVGAWKGNQIDKVFEALDATIAQMN